MLWLVVFVSRNMIAWSREVFYVIADSPERAMSLGRDRLAETYTEDPNDPDDGYLESIARLADEVIQ